MTDGTTRVGALSFRLFVTEIFSSHSDKYFTGLSAILVSNLAIERVVAELLFPLVGSAPIDSLEGSIGCTRRFSDLGNAQRDDLLFYFRHDRSRVNFLLAGFLALLGGLVALLVAALLLLLVLLLGSPC